MEHGPGAARAGTPQDAQMERAVLGCLLSGDKEAVSCVCEMLNLACFYDSKHQIIFKAGAELYKSGVPVDILTVRDKLEQTGQYEKLDPDYLYDLMNGIVSSANVEQYCKILLDVAGSRKALTLFQDAINSILEDPQRPDVEVIRQKFEEIAGGLAMIGNAVIKTQSFADYEQSMQSEPSAIATGFKELDKIAHVKPGAITIVAGRPSHGKTTFLLNLMMQQTEANPDKQFYFFSYEQTFNQLVTRLLMRQSGVVIDPYGGNYEQYSRYVKSRRADEPAIEAARRRLADLVNNRVFLVDERFPVEQLAAVLTQLSKRQNIGAVYIDYIQKIGTNQKSYSRQTELQAISNQLLGRALSLKIPIVMGAQFNREGVRAGRGQPQTSEPGAEKKRKPITEDYIREAGDIEQDANLILGLWDDIKEGGKNDGLAVYVLKNRDGEPRHKPTILNYFRDIYKISDANETPKQSAAGGHYEAPDGEIFPWEKD